MKKKKLLRLAVMLLILAMAAIALIGSSLGKYVKTFTGEANVIFSAELAEELVLRETEAERQIDGSYALKTGTYTDENEYILLPGLNVPKDPHVVIVGKTDIPAYLFVEVVDGLGNDAISYGVRDCWLEIPGNGKNGGTVYVYSENGAAKAIADASVASPVYILQSDTMVVGQELKHSASTSDILRFYACLGETAMGDTPLKVYKAVYNMP